MKSHIYSYLINDPLPCLECGYSRNAKSIQVSPMKPANRPSPLTFMMNAKFKHLAFKTNKISKKVEDKDNNKDLSTMTQFTLKVFF